MSLFNKLVSLARGKSGGNTPKYPNWFLQRLQQTTIAESLYEEIFQTILTNSWEAPASLLNAEWEWQEFDQFAQECREAEEKPALWAGYELNGPQLKGNVVDAVKYFTDEDMRDWLIAHDHPTRQLKTREDYENYFLQHVSYEALETTPEEVLEQEQAIITLRNEAERARILMHTLWMTMSNQRLVSQFKKTCRELEMGPDEWIINAVPSEDCSFELRRCAEFNQGKLRQIPPFFPGDRSRLTFQEKDQSLRAKP